MRLFVCEISAGFVVFRSVGGVEEEIGLAPTGVFERKTALTEPETRSGGGECGRLRAREFLEGEREWLGATWRSGVATASVLRICRTRR